MTDIINVNTGASPVTTPYAQSVTYSEEAVKKPITLSGIADPSASALATATERQKAVIAQANSMIANAQAYCNRMSMSGAAALLTDIANKINDSMITDQTVVSAIIGSTDIAMKVTVSATPDQRSYEVGFFVTPVGSTSLLVSEMRATLHNSLSAVNGTVVILNGLVYKQDPFSNGFFQVVTTNA